MADVEGDKIINPENLKPEGAENQIVPETIKPTEEEKMQPTGEIRPKETENKPPARVRLPQIRKPVVVPQVKDEIAIKVEKILEDGLGDAYQRLSPIAKQEFKIKGEKTAAKISELLRSTHVKVKKILRLIVEWLKILPGINRFFLEQEAKIKTDRIIELKNKQNR
jgi:hypothetical protein